MFKMIVNFINILDLKALKFQFSINSLAVLNDCEDILFVSCIVQDYHW